MICCIRLFVVFVIANAMHSDSSKFNWGVSEGSSWHYNSKEGTIRNENQWIANKTVVQSSKYIYMFVMFNTFYAVL